MKYDDDDDDDDDDDCALKVRGLLMSQRKSNLNQFDDLFPWFRLCPMAAIVMSPCTILMYM